MMEFIVSDHCGGIDLHTKLDHIPDVGDFEVADEEEGDD